MPQAPRYLEVETSRGIKLKSSAQNRGMGNGQSGPGKINSSKPFDFDSPDIDKNELMSIILMRLLEKTDIVDFLALINGPGMCGSYVVLLEKDLKKEFKQLQLSTTLSGKKEVESFLYTKAKDISSETPADTLICRELAIFYIRLIQLIGALTMSIYTPNNLVDRIRNDAYKRSIKKQRANIPLTLEQQAAQRTAQMQWLRSYILSSVVGSSELFTLRGKPQFKFNKATKRLSYTDSEGYKFDALLEVEEPEKYPVVEENKVPDSYWIILKNPKSQAIISRRLVSKDGRAFIYSDIPDVSKGPESAYKLENDWTEDINNDMSLRGEVVGMTASPSKRNNSHGFSKETLEELARAGISLNVLTKRGGGKRKNNRRKTLKGGAVSKQTNQGAAKPNFGPNTRLDKPFQESYTFIKNWSRATSTWTEASPASYRSTLLFIKPNVPNAAGTSYICVDNWSAKPMKQVAPYAALEALYRNKDDGTIGYDNQAPYRALLDKFTDLYQNYNGQRAAPKPANSFTDIIIPKLPEKIITTICSKSSPQGEVIMEDKYNQLLTEAQKELIAEHNRHFGVVYEYFKRIFVSGKDMKGELTVTLNTVFTKDSQGARAELEKIIKDARGIIAQHYIAVEELYFGTINKILNSV